jgi:hypothetical protein
MASDSVLHFVAPAAELRCDAIDHHTLTTVLPTARLLTPHRSMLKEM